MAWFKKILQDHARDQFCAGLREMGIDAELKPREMPEERLMDSWVGDSLGAITIAAGPIRWVNIRKDVSRVSEIDRTAYFAHYGVPDARLANSRLAKLNIRSARRRSFPLVGRVTGVYWKGDDLSSGILSALNDDYSLNEKLLDSEPIEIQAHSSSLCWTLTVCIRVKGDLSRWLSPPKFIPSCEAWQGYEAIAGKLLRAEVT